VIWRASAHHGPKIQKALPVEAPFPFAATRPQKYAFTRSLAIAGAGCAAMMQCMNTGSRIKPTMRQGRRERMTPLFAPREVANDKMDAL
jgi:hypothetical protein